MKHNHESHLFTEFAMFSFFLMKRDLFEKFLRYTRRAHGHSLASYLMDATPKTFLLNAFSWKDTDEGTDFWSRLHDEWLATYDILNHFIH